MAKTYYKEKQRFKDKVSLVIISLLGLATLAGGIKSLLAAEVDFLKVALLFGVTLLVAIYIYWLTQLKMKVTITDKGIKFKLSPVHAEKRFIAWKDITNCQIIKTSEAAKWSGGNISHNYEKNVSLTGRNGLAIMTKEGKRYFIGSSNVKELQQALDKIDLA